MARRVVVFGRARTLNDVPRPTPDRRRLGVLVLLVALAAAILAPLPADAQALDEGTVRAIAAESFPPGTADYATRIAWCESRYTPGATAAGFDRLWGWYRYVGLWQIDPALHSWRVVRLFGRALSLYDPWVNGAVAGEIQREQGWGAWPYCSRWAGR